MSLDPMPDAATLLRMKAEREARRVGYSHVVGTPPPPPTTITTTHRPGDPEVTFVMPNTPVLLRLPWSCLVSDNEKHVAFLRAGKPSIKITREYATAKERIQALARDVMGDRPAINGPCTLLARVWYPSAHPRDLTNWCKLVQDALSGIVYTDDRWLYDVRWVRAGVDVDAPHAALTLTPQEAA